MLRDVTSPVASAAICNALARPFGAPSHAASGAIDRSSVSRAATAAASVSPAANAIINGGRIACPGFNNASANPAPKRSRGCASTSATGIAAYNAASYSPSSDPVILQQQRRTRPRHRRNLAYSRILKTIARKRLLRRIQNARFRGLCITFTGRSRIHPPVITRIDSEARPS